MVLDKEKREGLTLDIYIMMRGLESAIEREHSVKKWYKTRRNDRDLL
jgi:predicted GIY-YIG superfamily endonuclease